MVVLSEEKVGHKKWSYGDILNQYELHWPGSSAADWSASEPQCLWLSPNRKREETVRRGSRKGLRTASKPGRHVTYTDSLRVHTCVSVGLLTVWITAILLPLFVLVERELSCKDEILFTFVIEWLWRERKHGGKQEQYICHVHAGKTSKTLPTVGHQEAFILLSQRNLTVPATSGTTLWTHAGFHT